MNVIPQVTAYACEQGTTRVSRKYMAGSNLRNNLVRRRFNSLSPVTLVDLKSRRTKAVLHRRDKVARAARGVEGVDFGDKDFRVLDSHLDRQTVQSVVRVELGLLVARVK